MRACVGVNSLNIKASTLSNLSSKSAVGGKSPEDRRACGNKEYIYIYLFNLMTSWT